MLFLLLLPDEGALTMFKLLWIMFCCPLNAVLLLYLDWFTLLWEADRETD